MDLAAGRGIGGSHAASICFGRNAAEGGRAMSVRISRRGVVCCRAFLDVPLSVRIVWGQLRDFQRFARQDPFHASINIDGGIPRAGTSLTLSHRYAGLRIPRVGRILVWREEAGYSFSDLSPR